MNGFLLDTHVFLWLVSDEQRVSEAVRAALRQRSVPAYLSAVSFWEIATKRARGGLAFSSSISAGVQDLQLSELSMTGSHCETAAALPWHHKDPFDRLLIAQASSEGLILISNDKMMAAYDVALLRT